MIAFAEKRFFEWHADDKSVSLRAKSGSYGGGSEVLILQRRFSKVLVNEADISPTLEAGAGEGGNNLPMILTVTQNTYQVVTDDETIAPLVATDYKRGGGVALVDVEKENTMSYQDTTGSLMASGYDKLGSQEASNDMYVTEEPSSWDGTQTAPTLSARNAGGGQRMPDKQNFNAVLEPTKRASVVRRLTPLECTRLQGFPDGWVDIGEWTDSKGKVHKDADSPKYQALGNSIALPFWKWLARKICSYYERPMTMGSLFDGIGGFPLAFELAGCRAVWASEIEEFCIAVTKKHFPEEEDQ